MPTYSDSVDIDFRGRPRSGSLIFDCNICGAPNTADLNNFDRETQSCSDCQSSPRWRALIAALSLELFGDNINLPDFPVSRHISGLGLTDWMGYARVLANKFDYRNTYFHKEPRLDIADVDSATTSSVDFLIASDIFEHVVPPIEVAFANAKRLLRPGGLLLLTVPWGGGPRTTEHFPHLHQFEILEMDGRHILRNLRLDGVVEEHSDIKFHGGQGAVLEMRLFGKADLIKQLVDAGFETVRVHERPNFSIGAYWPGNHSWPVAARVPVAP